ncbi:MAG: efflux RND transporter permease subunit [Methylophilaceae bacterium]|nr:efflux RND transporter permease subunit [Methyloradius sp.]
MNFSAWSIRKPTPAILLFIILTAAGFVGFKALGVQNFPDFDLPTVTVTVNLPGATPSQLETTVTRIVEDSISGIGAVKHITSTVSDGNSTTLVEFELEKDLQEAVNDVRDAVTRVRPQLPADVQEPIISRVNTPGGALMTFAIHTDYMDEADLSWFVDNTVSKTLLPVKGVGKVTRLGGINREVAIRLDPLKLQAMNVTASELSSQLVSVQQEAPGGRGNLGGMEQTMRTIGNVNSIEAIAAMSIPLSDGRKIRLDEVATIKDGMAERRQIALLDGKPIISFQVFRARGASEISVAKAVRAAVAKLMEDNPRIKIEEISNTVRPVEVSYKVSMDALYEGALLAVLVVWLFLRDWRATFVSAIALPLSVIPTFAVMSILGFSLNVITLLALTLMVGILVDDAIVEVENIVRHLRMGKPPFQAALEAADEIGLAVIATSLTLVAVFLPTAFMSGIPGKFFKQFGWTAAIAVLTSLLVARLLTPMMAAYLLKDQPAHKEDGTVMKRYLGAVRWCLTHPVLTSIATAIFFIASIALVSRLPSSFLPAGDTAQTTVTVESQPGSTIEQTMALAEQARTLIQPIKEVENIYTSIGTGTSAGSAASTTGDVRKAILTATLASIGERKRTQQQIEKEIRTKLNQIPGARISIGYGGNGEKLTVVLAGDDAALLQDTAQKVTSDLRTLPNLGNITSSASLLRPEIVIRPNFAKAAEYGVTAQAIGQAVRVATTGDYDVSLPKLNLPERQIPIRMMLEQNARDNLETVKQLRVKSSDGTIPLQNVADVTINGGPAQIDRYDRRRNITISIELQGRPLGDVTKEVNQLKSLQKLPAGVHRVASGDTERQAELFGGFLLAMVAGVFCVYGVMVLLFNDFLQPFTVLAALPLAVGGALGLLALLGYSLSLPSLIGLIMLMGIVTKNSILLVEYAITARRDHGLDRTAAIIDACHKRSRPILMTTIAMIAGMLPMALGLEGDSSFRAPMAMAVIGGLMTSTILSLLVIPVVFEIVDEFKVRLVRRFSGKTLQEVQPVEV